MPPASHSLSPPQAPELGFWQGRGEVLGATNQVSVGEGAPGSGDTWGSKGIPGEGSKEPETILSGSRDWGVGVPSFSAVTLVPGKPALGQSVEREGLLLQMCCLMS